MVEPSPAVLLTPVESVVAFSTVSLVFRLRLTHDLLTPRLDSLCAGDEGGWGWRCGVFSDDSKATGFMSGLVSMDTASFFLFD